MGIQINEDVFLVEVFDSSYKVDNRQEVEPEEYHKIHGITDHVRYDLDEGLEGHLHTWKRKGSYEIHHVVGENSNDPGSSGKWMPQKDVNVKFIGTMAGVAKRMIENGRSVRIVGNDTNGMFKHYVKIGAILSRQNGYVMSPSENYSLKSPNSVGYKEFTIRKYKENSGIVETMNYSITQSRVESNEYGINYNMKPRDCDDF